jgi:hypothetical protein
LGSGDADRDELDRSECDEHCGDEADDSDDGDSSFMISELGEDKLLLWIIPESMLVW